VFVWRGEEPGHVLLVNGGTHGDEYEGPTLLRQWAQQGPPPGLRGTVVLVPVLNEAAFFAGQRCHPIDGGNLARSFPGRPRGRPSERLAYLFDTELLAQSTHYIDLHSAGAAYELLPWVGYGRHSHRRVERIQSQMAACFAPYWCWASPPSSGRTLSAARQRGVPALYVECQGAGGAAPADLAVLDRGLQRVLGHLGMTAPPRIKPSPHPQIRRVTRDVDEAHLQAHHPAPFDGLFLPEATLGQRVRRGTSLGQVASLSATPPATITAHRTGRIVMLRRQRSVTAGDALATVVPI